MESDTSGKTGDERKRKAGVRSSNDVAEDEVPKAKRYRKDETWDNDTVDHWKMEEFKLDDKSLPLTEESFSTRKASIEKCIGALVHATQCRDAHCKQPSCIKMKKVLTHTKECKQLSRKWNQCNICKQFVLLCISHAKNCTDDKCHVPLCAAIKKNLKEQRKQRAV